MMRLICVLTLLFSPTVFAQQHVIEKTLPGTQLQIEMDDSLDEQTRTALADWAHASAASVTLAYGRFPVPNVRILLRPNQRWFWQSGSAVSFGRTTRTGGGTIELFIDPSRPIEEFYADWTATHEFSHLMLPLLDREHRWISEGFASYYQNVLMARAGRYDPDEAWRLLTAGIERGKNSRPDMSPNRAAEGGVREARMKYYWAGAALALMADVELRARSDGRESLDLVLGKLQQCCLPARYRWSAPRLFRRLDSFVDTPVFMPLWHRYADRVGFPDVDSALTDPEFAAIRANIMQSPF